MESLWLFMVLWHWISPCVFPSSAFWIPALCVCAKTVIPCFYLFTSMHDGRFCIFDLRACCVRPFDHLKLNKQPLFGLYAQTQMAGPRLQIIETVCSLVSASPPLPPPPAPGDSLFKALSIVVTWDHATHCFLSIRFSLNWGFLRQNKKAGR